jgi:hypothetical protein
MLTPSLAHPGTVAAVPAAGDRLRRWRHAAAAMIPSATFLAVAWTALLIPHVMHEGAQGWRLLANATSSAIFIVPMLVALVAIVDAIDVQRGYRSLAIAGFALLAAALGNTIDISALAALKVWPAPPWSMPVIWWANMGQVATLCVGAALVYDYRARSRARGAVLRAARLHSAVVARRMAETRLQAARARVDPRFLFDTLSAVERIHAIDAATGDRLLDDLIAFLRAVLPDPQERYSTLGHELVLARLWLDIRRTISNSPAACTVEASEDTRGLRFPPMTLIPLLEACLKGAPHWATVAVRARRIGAQTSVRIESDGPPGDAWRECATASEVRGRLRELCGDDVGLTFFVDQSGRRVAVVEGNFAQADGDHR